MLWLFLVSGVAAFLTVCDCQLAGDYVRYDNYSAVAFDNVAGFFVPNAGDCVAYSTVAPLTNGVVYNDALKTCVVLTANNNDIVIALRRNVGYETFVKDISKVTRQIFKAQRGGGSTNFGLYKVYANVTTLFTNNYSASVASLKIGSSCNCIYRNDFIDYWMNNIGAASLVNVQMIFGGMVYVSLTFTGVNQSYISWHSPDSLAYAAPYGAGYLRPQTYSAFSVVQASTRSFSITVASGFCSDFTFYIMSTYETSAINGCSGFYPYGTPTFSFAYSKTAGNPTSNSMGFADFYLISANIKSRVTLIN